VFIVLELHVKCQLDELVVCSYALGVELSWSGQYSRMRYMRTNRWHDTFCFISCSLIPVVSQLVHRQYAAKSVLQLPTRRM